jgi:hydrogenase nickel incorporation protein HypA/HybF
MHEMALMRDVVDVVVEQAEKVHAKGVRRVYLTIGDGRDVVMDLVDGLFEFLTRGTVAHGAELVIDCVPYTVRCNQCGAVFHIDVFRSETWVCPNCHAERDYTLNSGMEFCIDRIEVIGSDAPRATPGTGMPHGFEGFEGIGRHARSDCHDGSDDQGREALAV